MNDVGSRPSGPYTSGGWEVPPHPSHITCLPVSRVDLGLTWYKTSEREVPP